MDNPASDSPEVSLGDFIAALQAVADAVTANSREDYTRTVAHARSVGVSEVQIRDAYYYRARRRHGSWPSFDVDGNDR